MTSPEGIQYTARPNPRGPAAEHHGAAERHSKPEIQQPTPEETTRCRNNHKELQLYLPKSVLEKLAEKETTTKNYNSLMPSIMAPRTIIARNNHKELQLAPA